MPNWDIIWSWKNHADVDLRFTNMGKAHLKLTTLHFFILISAQKIGSYIWNIVQFTIFLKKKIARKNWEGKVFQRHLFLFSFQDSNHLVWVPKSGSVYIFIHGRLCIYSYNPCINELIWNRHVEVHVGARFPYFGYSRWSYEFCDTWNVHPNSINNTWAVPCHTTIAWTSLEHWPKFLESLIRKIYNLPLTSDVCCLATLATSTPLKLECRFFQILPKKNQVVGGFHPFEKRKMLVKVGSSCPQFLGWNCQKYLKPPSRIKILPKWGTKSTNGYLFAWGPVVVDSPLSNNPFLKGLGI